jgi:hypothetical protein
MPTDIFDSSSMTLLSRLVVTRVLGIDRSRHHSMLRRSFAAIVSHPPPNESVRSNLDHQILSSLSQKQQSLPELVKQYDERSSHVLDIPLPYESRPLVERRIDFEDDCTRVAMIAHCVRDGHTHKMTVCSGFALDGSRGDSLILTCAHTLEEASSNSLSYSYF